MIRIFVRTMVYVIDYRNIQFLIELPARENPESVFECRAPSTMPVAEPETPLAASIVPATKESSSGEKAALIQAANAIDEFSITSTEDQRLTRMLNNLRMLVGGLGRWRW